MDPGPLLDRVLDDEGLTSGLDEAEATTLIRLLTDRVRQLAAGTSDTTFARQQTDDLCRRARQIREVAVLFRDQGESAARSAAAGHGLRWPGGAATLADLILRMAGALDRRID